MLFPTPLIKGTILKRYKRFLADVIIQSDNYETSLKNIVLEPTVVYVANTGAMTSCWAKDWPVMLSYHDNPKRKLKYTLEMTYNGLSWIGINTSIANKIVIESIKSLFIPTILFDSYIKPEYKVGKSRIDIYLEYMINNELIKHFIEVKNVTLKVENNIAMFPDAVTTRGHKHLRELTSLVKEGYRASMMFIVQREDVSSFQIASHIDGVYYDLIKVAIKEGVEILVVGCKLSSKEIIPIKILPYTI